jgi:D-alanine-D-alanine ligase
VCPRIALIYNEPVPDHDRAVGEYNAVLAILNGVAAVHQALAESGYPVVRLPLLPPLETVRERLENIEADLVFNLFEGFDGHPEAEAIVTDFLSELGLIYTGCPGAALSLALDKVKAKTRMEAAGISTPRFQLLSPETLSVFHLNYPCIVKPCGEDASHGISEESVVHDFASLEKQVIMVSQRFKGRALVEEFVDGREFNVTVFGNTEPKTLPISEIVYSVPLGMPRILTFSAKWEPQSIYFEHTKAVCPAEISTKLQEHIAATALFAFRLLGCRGYARVDFRLDTKGKLKVLEVNPNPDISPDSGAALQARAAGMTYTQFIETIALLALEKE